MKLSESMPFMEAPPALDGSMAGDIGFDPLGLTKVFDIRWMRESELKHGRIAMLACVGFLVQEAFTLPAPYFPSMLAVDAHDYFVKTGGMSQLLLFLSALEVIGTVALAETMQGTREPGYFGFDPLNFSKDEASTKKFAENEVKNGRLAMIAIGGFIHYEWMYKTGIIDGLTHFKALGQ